MHDPDRPEGAPQASPEPVSVELSPALSGQLRALARRERTTVFMTMLAVFGVLVHRVTGQQDLLLASVVANRNRTEVENMIGCFTKKVLVRLAVDSDASFVELLPRIRASLLGALAHQPLGGRPLHRDVPDPVGDRRGRHHLPVARGAVHRPRVEQLLVTFTTLLADIVAHPTWRCPGSTWATGSPVTRQQRWTSGALASTSRES
ncbi:MAG: condensation domain-containing protein, partial [Actinomycetota bacterium]|nr:condensation domain-containing protein [Actinomycetota bacterium]